MPGFFSTAGYLENMTGPSGKPFNYSDAGIGGGLHPAHVLVCCENKKSFIAMGRAKQVE